MGIINFVDIIIDYMSYLILLRHGQSEWNKKNLFTGWVDIPLSAEGVKETFAAAEEIQNVPIDLIYTSSLIRGIMTAMLVMTMHQSKKVPVILHQGESKLEEWSTCYNKDVQEELIPVIRAWELNERMYGELQGKNKQEMCEQYGEEQIKIWRRSYFTAPPGGESLKMTSDRTVPYFENVILPQIKKGKNVLISAHGNSLRSIVMNLEKLSEEEVMHLEIPTGKPIIYNYCESSFKKRMS